MIKYYSTTISGKLYGIIEMDENFKILRFSFTKNPGNKKFKSLANDLKLAIDSGNAKIDFEKSDSNQLVYVVSLEE